MKKITILSTAHLCRNPRVYKEVISLVANGYEVSVITLFCNSTLLEEDLTLLEGVHCRYKSYCSLIKGQGLKALRARIFFKLGVFFCKWLGIENIYALGYLPFDYLKTAAREVADLYICHQELPTWVGIRLISMNKKVAFDFEDWYSRDLLPDARSKRPIKLLEQCELLAVQKGIFTLTTSKQLAAKLGEAFAAKEPNVIYNVFPSPFKLQLKLKESYNRLLWFSQTIGPGRGLEEFIGQLHFVEVPIELHLLGSCSTGFKSHLSLLAGHSLQLFFYEPVTNMELPGFISRFDWGLALEKQTPDSRNLTVTNKVFQYIQSGLPIIASKTMGQREILEAYQVGQLIENETTIPSLIRGLVQDKEGYLKVQRAVIEASESLNWENESQKFIQIVKNSRV